MAARRYRVNYLGAFDRLAGTSKPANWVDGE